MNELESIQNQVEKLTDAILLKAIEAGEDAYRPGFFAIYLREAEKRGIAPETVVKVQNDAARKRSTVDIVANVNNKISSSSISSKFAFSPH